jgi:hypothetical protein
MDDFLSSEISSHYHIDVVVEIVGKYLKNYVLIDLVYELLKLMVVCEWMRYLINEMVQKYL